MNITLKQTAIGLALSAFAPSAFADGTGIDKSKHTASAEYDFQFAVHKSNTVSGTDFGESARITLSGHAGKSKQYGFSLRSDTVRTSFTQKDADMDLAFTDAEINYRLFWVSTSLFLGSCEIKAKSQGTELIDAICVSQGFGLRGEYPLSDAATTSFGLESHTATAARDRSGRVVAVKRRIEADGSLSYNLLNYADILAGMRYRTFMLEIDGRGANEIQTGPYIGLRLGLTF